MTNKRISVKSSGIPSHSLQWQYLTSPDFAKAVRKTQATCIVPIGCLERHGGHLPLGTDTLLAQSFVEEAIKIEPAVMFPPLYFGWIHEAKHHPGAVALTSRLMLALLEQVCDEIARNGFKKIVILSYHGGNDVQLDSFVRLMLEKQRDYTLYYLDPSSVYPTRDPAWQAMRVIANDGHAGDDETSVSMAVHPQYINIKAMTKPGHSLGRLAHLTQWDGVHTAISWYANHPGCYSGDARNASVKKGHYLFAYAVKRLALLIGIIKKDRVTPKLQSEFFSKIKHR